MKHFSHLNTSVNILQQYQGKEPFNHFIKSFFRQQKKFGSSDRRAISNLCYYYFRLGHSLPHSSIEEKILTGLFLCSNKPDKLLEDLKPEWNEKIALSLNEKYSILTTQYSIFNIFPWTNELSEGIDDEKFCLSFLNQPRLFLRLRPGYETIVKQKLKQAEIEFDELSSFCLSLPNSSKIEELLDLDKEAVIQDYSSQRVREFLKPSTVDNRQLTVWDCCAGSGGKSIMAKDVLGDIKLTVSDVRKSILYNLEKRFKKAGIKNYKSFVTDLSTANNKPQITNFDLIIADVPCTGSGTWSRTPEALCFFDKHEIERYSSLQKKIISNIIPYLKKGGALIYITCSVFKKENEEVVSFIRDKFHLRLAQMELLKGYDQKADSMFVACFIA